MLLEARLDVVEFIDLLDNFFFLLLEDLLQVLLVFLLLLFDEFL
jgi:hypothetical protein